MNNRLLSKNIKYLFKLNKEKNKLTKAHFLKYLNISYGAVEKWEKGGNISKKNLNAIVEYFNKHLNLDINVQDLMSKDLSKMPIIINDSYGNYFYNALSDKLSDKEQKLINEFRLLDTESKMLILRLVEKLNK